MRFAGFAGSVIDQRVGQSHAVVGEIEAVRVDAIERIERRRGQAGRIERIEDMDRAEAGAMAGGDAGILALRSEEQPSELQSLMRISSAVFCLKKKKQTNTNTEK